MQVELIYEKSCPNIEAARKQLLLAFKETGITPKWEEWDVSTTNVPEHVRGFGSPTIMVNGKDVSGEKPAENDNCCRIYPNSEGGFNGVPKLSDITEALKQFANVDESLANTTQVNTNHDT